MDYFDIAVIGGGSAGMMAGIAAGEDKVRDTPGIRVCLLERNDNLGIKLLLTGNGRCNLTTTKSIKEIVTGFGPKGSFLYSSLSKFSNLDLINFFEARGIKTKVERDQRVFPADDKAVSILNCLKNELKNNKVKVIFNFRTVKIEKQKDYFKIFSGSGQSLYSRKVIIATGGKSYPETGSTGDGYLLAKNLGHKISPLKPALVPLFVKNEEIRSLAGLDLDNVNLTVMADGKPWKKIFGDVLFTHQGISGPIVLSVSRDIYDLFKSNKGVTASLDLKPALNKEKLRQRINRDVLILAKKEFQTLLAGLLPNSLIPYVLERLRIERHKRNGNLTKEEKDRLTDFLKNFTFKIDGVAPIEVGIVTAGGVKIEEIDQRTMESKIIPGLYFAGEIIGLDGPTGGFNLTKAFSTGWVAGKSANNKQSPPKKT